MIQNTNYGASKSYVDGALSNTYTKAQVDTYLAAKANDNAVVHLAGAEMIPGAKTFTTNRGVTMKATQSYNTFEVSSRGFTNNIEAKAYTTDGSSADQHFTIGTSYSNASREVWHAIAYAPRVTRGDTSEAQTEMRLSMNINNNNTGEAYLSFGRNDGVSAPDLVLGKFANGVWTPTMVNDALDTYAPMVRTTGNQTIGGTKTFSTINVGYFTIPGADGQRRIQINRSDDDLDVVPSANIPYPIISWNDKDGDIMGGLYISHNIDGTTSITAITRNSDKSLKYEAISKGAVI